MSYSINVIQRWLATVEHPAEMRQMIDAIHKYCHDNNDLLNHDKYVRRSAERLEKWLDEQAAAQQSVQPTVPPADAQAQPDNNPSEVDRPASGG